MKRVFALLLSVLLIGILFSCYIPLKTTEDFGLIFSPEIGVNKYFGGAIGVCGEYAFVGDPNVDGVYHEFETDKAVKKEAGRVYMLRLNKTDSKWEYLRYNSGKEGEMGEIVAFSYSECEEFDAFGSSIYVAISDTDPSKRFLLVTALLRDTKYGDVATEHSNNGEVYLYQIPDDTTLEGIPALDGAGRASAFFNNPIKINLEDTPVKAMLPKEGSSHLGCANINKSEDIDINMVNPGIGFGYTVRMDADTGTIVVGAPYESYYKALHGEDMVLVSYVGAAYVFAPTTPGDLSTLKLQTRLMPMWGQPLYNNVVYYDSDGTYLGEIVKPKTDASGNHEVEVRCDDRAKYYFGENIAISGDMIVVGVPSAPFQYYRESAGGKPSVAGQYYDKNKTIVDAPSEEIKKYTVVNEAMGTVYVYTNNGTEWEFNRRCDRCQLKKDNESVASKTSKFEYTIPGSYIVKDGDDFYQYGYYDGENLGMAVEIYKNYIIAGVPYRDSGVTGNKNIGINRVFNDIGAIAFIPKSYTPNLEKENNHCQLVRYEDIYDSTIKNDDDPFWGENFIRRGDILAVASPGTDYLTLQWTCGSVNFYKIDGELDTNRKTTPIEKILTEEVGHKITVKEMYKGDQTLGRWMDFSPESKWIICGLPGFGMNVYYNKPYVQKYWLPNCGSLYTFKWNK